MNRKNSLLAATAYIEIPFHDCDPMNVVWHGNYARYLEIARCALLRKFDYDYLQMKESGYMWPIVDMQIKYVAPLIYTQTIKVSAFLKEYENRLKIDYLINDSATGKTVTKASTIQVAVDIQNWEMQFASPSVIHEKLRCVL